MRKTVKKLDDNVIKALTKACETGKETIAGFEWLTHTANYDNFPGSLAIICVFDNNQSLSNAHTKEEDVYLRKLIHSNLLKAGILLKDARKHVRFDSEENCSIEHDGNWKVRLNSKQ
ncbi:MAG: hypothetical protein ACI88A_001205 [Paraglaciecola sp.]|jgi:hypothetical protein